MSRTIFNRLLKGVLIAFTLLLFIGCKSTKSTANILKKMPCNETRASIFKNFPDKLWQIDDISGYSNCQLYHPLVYFDNTNMCVFSTVEKQITGTYKLYECDNLLEIQMPTDTLLFTINKLEPPIMNLTQVVKMEDQLGVMPWHFKQQMETKNDKGK